MLKALRNIIGLWKTSTVTVTISYFPVLSISTPNNDQLQSFHSTVIIEFHKEGTTSAKLYVAVKLNNGLKGSLHETIDLGVVTGSPDSKDDLPSYHFPQWPCLDLILGLLGRLLRRISSPPCSWRTMHKILSPQPLGPIAFLVNAYALMPTAFYCSTPSLTQPRQLLQQNNQAGKNSSHLSISVTLAQPKEENPRPRGRAFPFVILLRFSFLRFPKAWGCAYTLGTGSPLLALQEFTI